MGLGSILIEEICPHSRFIKFVSLFNYLYQQTFLHGSSYKVCVYLFTMNKYRTFSNKGEILMIKLFL